MTSETTKRANQVVEELTPEARGLGLALVELIDYPDEFVVGLRDGLRRLGDPPYAAEQERVAPGTGSVFGVRAPLISAVQRQLRPALEQASPAAALWLAERLVVEEEREFVFFAQLCLERSLGPDPERSWQLMRRLARLATDWIRVDTLAALFAKGILLEPVRWAELEQLVYSSSRWERRLIGSTVAVLPLELAKPSRSRLAPAPALSLIHTLIGDADQNVQKALAWALRSWLEVDREGVRTLIRDEAAIAAATDDGNRAWVLRDALSAPSTEPQFALEIRERLVGVRRRPGSASTSVAADVAGRFMSAGGMGRLSDQAVDMQGDRQRRSATRGAAQPAGRRA